MGHATKRKAAPKGSRSRSGGRTKRDDEIRRLRDLGIKVAVIVVVSGLSKRQVERILAPADGVETPAAQKPRVRACDPRALEQHAALRQDRRHNGRHTMPRVDEDPDDDESQDDQTSA